jgi:uncharacterized membrane protein
VLKLPDKLPQTTPVNVLTDHLSFTSQLISWVLFAIVLGLAIWRAPWFHLKDTASMNILLAMIVGIMVIWTMKAGFAPGLSIHLLGTTLLTLMFGWAFAILGIVVVLAGHALYSGTGWAALPAEALLLGALPGAVSYMVFRLVDTRLPNNFFVYIFLVAFLGAALAIAATVAATTLVHVASGAYAAGEVWYNYTRYILLAMFPEAFITGMLMTLFVAYRPEWVSTFDDSRYLKDK